MEIRVTTNKLEASKSSLCRLPVSQTLLKTKLSAYSCPGIIVSGHGPFSWGTDIKSSVINSEILEFVAKTTYLSMQLKIKNKLPKYISNKHYQRKHGKKAYYGQ